MDGSRPGGMGKEEKPGREEKIACMHSRVGRLGVSRFPFSRFLLPLPYLLLLACLYGEEFGRGYFTAAFGLGLVCIKREWGGREWLYRLVP